jgi:hypothetical protein
VGFVFLKIEFLWVYVVIEEVGRNSIAYTNLARRTEVNFHDVAQALQIGGIELDALYKWEAVSDEVPFNTGKIFLRFWFGWK